MTKRVNKLTPHTDGKRRKMHMVKLTAVALTSRGANPEAHVTFFKSDKSKTVVDKHGGDLADLLTSEEKGHQHGITVETYDGSLYINVMYGLVPDSDVSHYHALVADESGGFTVSINNGHSHTIEGSLLNDVLLSRLIKREDTITKEQAQTLIKIEFNNETEESDMSKELQALLDAAKAELAKSQAALAVATAIGTFSDTAKSYYNGLGQADKDLFVAKSTADRNAELEVAAKADPIEFTSASGVEYRKSAGTSMIGMAKQLDEQAKELTVSAALVKNAEFAKRASTEMETIVGEDAHKVALLRAIDCIEDEDTRKGVLNIIASANGLGKTVTNTFGTEEPNTQKVGEGELDILVKKYATDNSVDEATAYEKVLNTAAGQAAYNKDVTNA